MKMKVKVFFSRNTDDITTDVNEFLDSLSDPKNQVRDIKFSSDENGFSVLIILSL